MTSTERAVKVVNYIIKIELENAALKGVLGTIDVGPGRSLEWEPMVQQLKTSAAVRDEVQARYADVWRLLSDADGREPHITALHLIDGLAKCWESS
jgi:hypothetical protein